MRMDEHLEQLRQLDDDGLLRSLKRHVGSEKRLNALVLAHLAEVDARGAYRQWACDTLATYCVYELRLSEDEAQRRSRAARVARQFPLLLEMLAEGSIHLTGILLLAPHLTNENHRELLARARYRRKREIERLVAEVAPARDVPALIEPLRCVAPSAGHASSTWAALVAGQAGWVRRLEAGDGPTQAPSVPDAWHDALVAALEHDSGATVEPCAAVDESEGSVDAERAGTRDESAGGSPVEQAGTAGEERVSSASRALRYRVQFTADQEYVDLLERARGLLWHQLPNGGLAAIQRLALEALVEKLARRKCGAPRSDGATGASFEPARPHAERTARPKAPAARETERESLRESAAPARSDAESASLHGRAAPARSDAENQALDEAAARSDADSESLHECAAPARSDVASESLHDSAAPARSAPGADSCGAGGSRHIPTEVRREVWRRDEGRCTFVDARGVRCRATRAIEFHHERPYARGGPSCVENVTLRCRAHNELAAEHDFGRGFVQAMKQGRGLA